MAQSWSQTEFENAHRARGRSLTKEERLPVGMGAALGLGGDEGDRTLDLFIANEALSRLSYIPKNAPSILHPGNLVKNQRMRPNRSKGKKMNSALPTKFLSGTVPQKRES